MKMQTSAGQLRASLRLFRGIIQRRNTTPILGTIRFQDGRLTGTDLDTEVSVALPSIGKMDGAAAVDWLALDALAGCIDADEEVTLIEDDGLATVSFNGSEYRLPSWPASDFPEFGPVEGARTMADNLGLVAALTRVRFAVSTENTRYYLNGVAILNAPDGKPIVAATNGHRLALLPLDAMPEGAAGAIIPNNLVHYLARQKREPAACTFDADKPRAQFEFAGMSLSAKLIDGTFPDIFRVIPSDPKRVFTVHRERALRVLHRLRAFVGRMQPVKLAGSGSSMTISFATRDQQATETIALDEPTAQPFEVGYNIDYLISALGQFRGEQVTFSVEHEITSSPALLTCLDDPLEIVQMPMRV